MSSRRPAYSLCSMSICLYRNESHPLTIDHHRLCPQLPLCSTRRYQCCPQLLLGSTSRYHCCPQLLLCNTSRYHCCPQLPGSTPGSRCGQRQGTSRWGGTMETTRPEMHLVPAGDVPFHNPQRLPGDRHGSCGFVTAADAQGICGYATPIDAQGICGHATAADAQGICGHATAADAQGICGYATPPRSSWQSHFATTPSHKPILLQSCKCLPDPMHISVSCFLEHLACERCNTHR
jgi:hypothetical protein